MGFRQKASVFQSAEVQKLWVLGKRQEAKVKREEKYVYLTSLGNAISVISYQLLVTVYCLLITVYRLLFNVYRSLITVY